jgi:hypothetical protein
MAEGSERFEEAERHGSIDRRVGVACLLMFHRPRPRGWRLQAESSAAGEKSSDPSDPFEPSVSRF